LAPPLEFLPPRFHLYPNIIVREDDAETLCHCICDLIVDALWHAHVLHNVRNEFEIVHLLHVTCYPSMHRVVP